MGIQAISEITARVGGRREGDAPQKQQEEPGKRVLPQMKREVGQSKREDECARVAVHPPPSCNHQAEGTHGGEWEDPAPQEMRTVLQGDCCKPQHQPGYDGTQSKSNRGQDECRCHLTITIKASVIFPLQPKPVPRASYLGGTDEYEGLLVALHY